MCVCQWVWVCVCWLLYVELLEYETGSDSFLYLLKHFLTLLYSDHAFSDPMTIYNNIYLKPILIFSPLHNKVFQSSSIQAMFSLKVASATKR